MTMRSNATTRQIVLKATRFAPVKCEKTLTATRSPELAAESVVNLRTGRFIVDARIGRIIELTRDKAAGDFCCQLVCFFDRALHALLLTQARDKNYYYETTDSMISIALSYYGDSNDDYHKMLAFFYMGCIKFYCNDLSLSIINYTEAEKIAQKINDWFYLGMIYQGMSYVYSNVYNSTEQLSYAELSYDAFKKYDDVSYTMYALKDLSMAYNNTMEYEKAVNIAKQVIDSAIKMQDSTLLIESLRMDCCNIILCTEEIERGVIVLQQVTRGGRK